MSPLLQYAYPEIITLRNISFEGASFFPGMESGSSDKDFFEYFLPERLRKNNKYLACWDYLLDTAYT